MKRLILGFGVLTLLTFGSVAWADTFGTGVNQFSIDFVPISGSTNPTVEQAHAGDLDGFGIVDYDYRMGMYEVTNAQWDKFKAGLGVPVTGNPSSAYDQSVSWTGADSPTDSVSWYEAAQFTNWLNTSTGHLPAYNFTGTQGTSNYTFATWSAAEAAGGTNLYRHKDAFYFLPSEDEWVKAAYWNGTSIQNYATKAGESLRQGDGTTGEGWNYYDGGYATDPRGPWNVGSGSEELNGTFDMMGNNWEWIESPWNDPPYYGAGTWRSPMRGGFWHTDSSDMTASYRYGSGTNPMIEGANTGFRVASVPEPGSITLLAMGAVALLAYAWRRRRRRFGGHEPILTRWGRFGRFPVWLD